MAPALLLVALLVVPWLLMARSGSARRASRTAAWTAPAPQQPQRPWSDPDDWWREPSGLPSRLPLPTARSAASPLEI